jgi:hypothetical protein
MHYTRRRPPAIRSCFCMQTRSWGFSDIVSSVPILTARRVYRLHRPAMECAEVRLFIERSLNARALQSLDGHSANLVRVDAGQLESARTRVSCVTTWAADGIEQTCVHRIRSACVRWIVMSTWAWRDPALEFHRRIFPWPPDSMHRWLALSARPAQLRIGLRGVYLSEVASRALPHNARRRTYEAFFAGSGTTLLLTWTWPRWEFRWTRAHVPGRSGSRLVATAAATMQRLPRCFVWGHEEDVFAHDVFRHAFSKKAPAPCRGAALRSRPHFPQEDSGP